MKVNRYSILNQHIKEKNENLKKKYAEIAARINKKSNTKLLAVKRFQHKRFIILNNETYSLITAVFICLLTFIFLSNMVISNNPKLAQVNKTVQAKLNLLFNSNHYRINAIIKHSKDNGFHPFLTSAIIFMESSNKVFEISRVNARGLMQVRRETGYDAARWKGKKRLADIIRKYPQILYVPHINIELATYYIKRYKRILKLNWRAALHAYNVGPTAYLRGQRHYYYVNRIMTMYNDFKNLSIDRIAKKYYYSLIYMYKIKGKILN